MLKPDAKRLAYATMDDAESFQLVMASEAPEGEQVVELVQAASIEELLPVANLIRKMARTFFPSKLAGISPRPDLDGPVALYLVAELMEIDAADLVALSEEGELRLIEE